MRRDAIAGVVPAYPVYLFDVDGTLLDSAADICGAIAQVLERNGAPPQPYEFLKSYVGLHLNALFGEVFPDAGPERLEELLQEYRTTYWGRGHAATTVFPGVAEARGSLGGLLVLGIQGGDGRRNHARRHHHGEANIGRHHAMGNGHGFQNQGPALGLAPVGRGAHHGFGWNLGRHDRP